MDQLGIIIFLRGKALLKVLCAHDDLEGSERWKETAAVEQHTKTVILGSKHDYTEKHV